MRFKVGNIVKLDSSIGETNISDVRGIHGSAVGVFRQGEIAMIIKIDDPSMLQVQLITSSGVIGWVVGAWLKTLV